MRGWNEVARRQNSTICKKGWQAQTASSFSLKYWSKIYLKIAFEAFWSWKPTVEKMRKKIGLRSNFFVKVWGGRQIQGGRAWQVQAAPSQNILIHTMLTNITFTMFTSIAFTMLTNITFTMLTNITFTMFTNITFTMLTNIAFTMLTNITFTMLTNITFTMLKI